jgi:hypothetical protein
MNSENNSSQDYFLLLFQSEFNNLISTKELTSEIFYSMIENMNDVVLKNNEFMDLYLCENLFSTLLPGLESLSKNVEKLMFHSGKEDDREVNRFNACNYLAEFLMRNNPKYGKNKETHEKFLKYTRKERKSRMIKVNEETKLRMFKKVTDVYNTEKMKLNKTNIIDFVNRAEKALKLNNTLNKYDWIEHFRVYKDDAEITLEKFLEAFSKAILEIHEIDEEMVKILLK